MNKTFFYKTNLKKLIKDKEAKILVVAGSQLDKQVFMDLGFKNVILSNLDSRMNQNEFKPYQWSFQDAENLTYDDNEFDFAVIHAALHHCRSPHKALLEMYRVSKKGVFSVEAKDSLLMKLAVKFNLTYQYEIDSVFDNDMKYGGVANTEIPNFVYRWTENEIEKVVNCYAPFSKHKIRYFYGFSLPKFRTQFPLNRLLHNILKIILQLIPKKQGNLFAFFIEKPNLYEDYFPWIIYKENKFSLNKEWLRNNWKMKK